MPQRADVDLAVRSTDELEAHERDAIIELCVASHGQEDFRNLFNYIPTGGRHFLARHDDELVSHAVVTTRWLRLETGRRLRTAYVDAVATAPGHQGRGHAAAVMDLLARSIDDHEIGCLETEAPAFYQRLGWELWRGPLGGLRAGAVMPTPDQDGVMVLRLSSTPKLDLDGELLVETDGGRIW